MGLPLAAALAMTTAPGLDLDEVPEPDAVIPGNLTNRVSGRGADRTTLPDDNLAPEWDGLPATSTPGPGESAAQAVAPLNRSASTADTWCGSPRCGCSPGMLHAFAVGTT